ncbi:hypothetical protein [Serratia sp. CY85251]|uniref:hypothetical protein n=1 Tax=Serratia sp. CY85251 TaxID=3383696 RepID=UPI003F9FB039
MSQTRDQQAYQRGIKAARLWKRLKGTILRWDQLCVSKARAQKLPGWIGHGPMAIALIASVAIIVFGGIVIIGCMLLISAIAYIFQHVGQSNYDADHFDSNTDNKPLTEYRDGDQGYGLYSGSYRMDLDDD